jgi:hypothetical protein
MALRVQKRVRRLEGAGKLRLQRDSDGDRPPMDYPEPVVPVFEDAATPWKARESSGRDDPVPSRG